MLNKFLKQILSKTKKYKNVFPYSHKSTKSMTSNTFNIPESINNKRKLSSPKKTRTPSAYAYSNQKIDPSFKKPEGILFYRHSERRDAKVRNFT
jgi:hypothetical protein